MILTSQREQREVKIHTRKKNTKVWNAIMMNEGFLEREREVGVTKKRNFREHVSCNP